MGPNQKKLIAHKLSVAAIPANGGLMDGIEFILDQARFKKTVQESTAWVAQAIQAVRNGGEPNRFRDADDETIAGDILREIAVRKAAQLKVHYAETGTKCAATGCDTVATHRCNGPIGTFDCPSPLCDAHEHAPNTLTHRKKAS